MVRIYLSDALQIRILGYQCFHGLPPVGLVSYLGLIINVHAKWPLPPSSGQLYARLLFPYYIKSILEMLYAYLCLYHTKLLDTNNTYYISKIISHSLCHYGSEIFRYNKIKQWLEFLLCSKLVLELD